jgi:hypothetical protein
MLRGASVVEESAKSAFEKGIPSVTRF